MLYLIGSILFSSYLTLSFKVLQKLKINVFQTIVFNYLACVGTGSLVNGAFPINSKNVQSNWFVWAIIMGILFVSIFNLIGFSTQKLGVAVVSVANKLSLVIPFLFSIFLYNENSNTLKIVGIILAVIAVTLTCYKSNFGINGTSNTKILVISLPIILFISSGLLDTLIVFVKNKYFATASDNFNDFLISAFALAGCIGIIILSINFYISKIKFDFKAVLAGIIIGVPNYFSIWFLGKLIESFKGKSSVIIPINNMGIVLFSSIVAWVVFKEKLSVINWLGILLALIAIAFIAIN